MSEQELKYKLCIFGDGGVGKTTLTHRFLEGVFKDSYKLTIGMDFFIKTMDISGKRVKLHIWDFAGEQKFRFLLPGAVSGAHGTILMFDITRYLTFRNIYEWLNAYNKSNKELKQEVPTILVGSKLDLSETRTVSNDDALKFAGENNILEYLECSSKSGENVDKVFGTIGKIMMDAH
jgi:small GTP-binding protein